MCICVILVFIYNFKQFFCNSAFHFGCGCIGKGYDKELVNIYIKVNICNEFYYTLNQNCGFARPCRGTYEDVTVTSINSILLRCCPFSHLHHPPLVFQWCRKTKVLQFPSVQFPFCLHKQRNNHRIHKYCYDLLN